MDMDSAVKDPSISVDPAEGSTRTGVHGSSPTEVDKIPHSSDQEDSGEERGEEEEEEEEISLPAKTQPIKWSERPKWKDVTPIPLPRQEFCAIRYTEYFEETMSYFRALLKTGEISERAMELTTAAIELNMANYTAWHYRRRLLFELGLDIRKDLEFTTKLALGSMKNYQLWHHRKELFSRAPDVERELTFIDTVLSKDAKNYHAWS